MGSATIYFGRQVLVFRSNVLPPSLSLATHILKMEAALYCKSLLIIYKSAHLTFLRQSSVALIEL